MKEMGFALEQRNKLWPPFAVEWIWCGDFEGDHLIINAPFFVKGLSVGDVIRVTQNDDGHVVRFQPIERSSRSTLWIKAFQPDGISDALERLRALGCNIEALAQYNYFAIDVPAETAIVDVDRIVAAMGKDAIEHAFPSFRH